MKRVGTSLLLSMGRFRRWIIRLFLGKDMVNYINATIQLTDLLNHHIADIKQNQLEMAKLVASLTEHGPAEGWVPMATNAIIGLDKRVEILATVLQKHQDNFDKIITNEGGIEVIDLSGGERSN